MNKERQRKKVRIVEFMLIKSYVEDGREEMRL